MVEEPLVDEPRLRKLQGAYRAEPSLLERRPLALAFQKEVRKTAADLRWQALRGPNFKLFVPPKTLARNGAPSSGSARAASASATPAPGWRAKPRNL